MSNIVPFEFESLQVRVIERDGEPWFVAADIAGVLDIGRTDDAVRRLDAEEKDADTIRTPGGDQKMIIVNESGLYSLILTSRKEAAKRFKKWVTAEVLPSIRKTGRYGATDPMAVLNDPAAMRSLLLTYTEKVLALESEVTAFKPLVAAFERISASDGSLCITDAAKALDVPPRKLFTWLSEHKWIYRRIGPPWISYQEKIQAGYMEQKVTTISRPNEYDLTTERALVTSKGMARLSVLLGTKQKELSL
jgi:prophage antirepressor-like protein